jgi:hypothetical protein
VLYACVLVVLYLFIIKCLVEVRWTLQKEGLQSVKLSSYLAVVSLFFNRFTLNILSDNFFVK